MAALLRGLEAGLQGCMGGGPPPGTTHQAASGGVGPYAWQLPAGFIDYWSFWFSRLWHVLHVHGCVEPGQQQHGSGTVRSYEGTACKVTLKQEAMAHCPAKMSGLLRLPTSTSWRRNMCTTPHCAPGPACVQEPAMLPVLCPNHLAKVAGNGEIGLYEQPFWTAEDDMERS
jgi:hypothetical protein